MAMATWQTLDTLYEGPDGGPITMREGIEQGVMFCEYAAMCTDTATTTIEHPIVGDLPICRRHAAFYASMVGGGGHPGLGYW